MRSIFGIGFALVTWPYAGLLVAWFVLYHWLGDAVWWLALLNVFAPFLFLPLIVILPACVLLRRRLLWAGAVLPLSLFVLLYGTQFVPALSTPAVAESESLNIMSFNVWAGSQPEAIARAILAAGEPDGTDAPAGTGVPASTGVPDVVALQELTPFAAQGLADELGHLYPYRALAPASLAGGLGLLSRYPIVELDAGRVTGAGWRVRVFQIEFGERALTVYNVHFPSWSFWGGAGAASAIPERLQAGIRSRNELAEMIVEDMAARTGPIVVTGDFNCTDRSEAYATLTGSLADAHWSAGWGLGHTFPAYRGWYGRIPIMPRLVRLDMILHTDDLVALDSHVGTDPGASDHMPVLAELAWRQE